MQWNLEWATAHSGVESRYNALYRERQGKEARSRLAWTGKDWATIRPRTQHVTRSARTRDGLAVGGVCRDIIKLYRDRKAAWPLGCIARQARHGRGKSHDTTQGAAIRAAALAGARRHRVQHNERHGQACAATRPGVRCDKVECVLRHGRAKPTTWPGQAYDMAGPGLQHGAWCATIRPAQRAVGVQPGSGCAPGAPNPVLTKCNVWDIVHEHCS